VHAASEIADRLEGRAPQHIAISDFAAELRTKSDQELEFHLKFGRWPSDEELMTLQSGQSLSS